MKDAPTPPEWSRQLKALLDSVRIESKTSFLFRGRRVDASSHTPAHVEDDCFDPDPLLHMLHRQLYACFHKGVDFEDGDPAPAAGDVEEDDYDDDRDEEFRARLSEAYGGPGRLSRGWKVLAPMSGGEVCAEKGRRVRVWRPGQYLFDGAPARAKKGDSVDALLRRNSLTLQPGFFYAFGGFAADELCEWVPARFYLNASAEGAAEVVRLVADAFDARAVPFTLKCLCSESDYSRRDSAVLYVGRRYAHVAFRLLEELYPRLRAHLRAETPLLTKTLAPGLALAEDPNADDSFGTHRTRAVARGLHAAFLDDKHADGERLEYVLKSFEKHNISTTRPHLNAKPEDPYGIDLLELRV